MSSTGIRPRFADDPLGSGADTLRGGRAGLALVLAACTAFYLPSLWFGYYYDDFWILTQGLWDAHPLHLVRPVWNLQSWLAAQISPDPMFQRAVSLAAFNAMAVVGYLLVRRYGAGLLVLLVLLAHPMFVYPVTWISQRADLIFIAFVGLALLARSGAGIAAWTILSMLVKTPFIAHAAVFAWSLARERRLAAGLAVAAALVAMAVASYLMAFAYHPGGEVEARGGMHVLKNAGLAPLAFLGVFLAGGAAKVIESLAMIFVPFPATYGLGPLFFTVTGAQIAAWLVLAWILIRGGAGRIRWMPLAVGLAAATAFIFTAQLRAIAPAGFFILLGLLAALPPTPLARAMLGVLLAANLAGSVAVYRATDTGCFDLAQPGAVRACQEPEGVPNARWQADRGRLVLEVSGWLKGRYGKAEDR